MVVFNIIVLFFVVGVGFYVGFRNGWKGYE